MPVVRFEPEACPVLRADGHLEPRGRVRNSPPVRHVIHRWLMKADCPQKPRHDDLGRGLLAELDVPLLAAIVNHFVAGARAARILGLELVTCARVRDETAAAGAVVEIAFLQIAWLLPELLDGRRRRGLVGIAQRWSRARDPQESSRYHGGAQPNHTAG